MPKRLTRIEMRETLDNFVDCYNAVIVKYTDTEKIIIEEFIEQTSLMIPCYSIRPDKILSLNNSVFNDPAVTQFILDLSFRFLALNDDGDLLEKLTANLESGLRIDGFDITNNIIPKSIAQSCPSNVFDKLDKPRAWWKKFFGFKSVNHLRYFLLNNKHIVVIYLLYLTNQE